MFSTVVAIDINKGIAKDGKIPWHYPEDLKFFKELTTGHVVIMGRKTYESIGHPLPNRINIVISS
jgi:dihydrofolate reductase